MSPYFILTDASSCALLFLSNTKGGNIFQKILPEILLKVKNLTFQSRYLVPKCQVTISTLANLVHISRILLIYFSYFSRIFLINFWFVRVEIWIEVSCAEMSGGNFNFGTNLFHLTFSCWVLSLDSVLSTKINPPIFMTLVKSKFKVSYKKLQLFQKY